MESQPLNKRIWTPPFAPSPGIYDAEGGRGTIGGGEGAPQLVEVTSVSPSFFSILGTALTDPRLRMMQGVVPGDIYNSAGWPGDDLVVGLDTSMDETSSV